VQRRTEERFSPVECSARGLSHVRCERCGYELSAEAERLLAELRAVLSRMDLTAKVVLSWESAERLAIDYSGWYPKGFASKINGAGTTPVT